MTQELKTLINSGEFYSRFKHSIYSPNDFIGLKWIGKYVCEIERFSLQEYFTDHKIHMQLQLYSDYGIGPIIYINENELESFIKGEPLYDGSYLVGKGLKSFQEFCLKKS